MIMIVSCHDSDSMMSSMSYTNDFDTSIYSYTSM